ncbi:LysR family transcriptional regulator [Enterobacter soli]|uniref:LysR family transcriptional regulator n=1 Tax=Enterobacter soli TaxID=885040 RepID=UPI0034CF7C3C
MSARMFELMNIFVEVAEQGSFARAADVLHLHRPAVTKAIQQLEDDLGTRLMHRTTRRISLTSEGEAFLQRAKMLLNDVDDVMASFSSTRPPRGRLRVDTPLSLAHAILIPALSAFQARYPDIEIELTSSDHRVDMVAEGIDCVIRMGELQDSSLVSRRLGEARLVTCAAPAYLDRCGEPKTPDDLAGHNAVMFFAGHSRTVMDWRFTQNGEARILRPARTMLVDNSDILLSCGLAGLGILQGIHAVLAPHLQAGRLVEVLGEYTTAAKPVSVLYPDRRYLAPKVRVFVDWLSELFAANGDRLQGLLLPEKQSTSRSTAP